MSSLLKISMPSVPTIQLSQIGIILRLQVQTLQNLALMVQYAHTLLVNETKILTLLEFEFLVFNEKEEKRT